MCIRDSAPTAAGWRCCRRSGRAGLQPIGQGLPDGCDDVGRPCGQRGQRDPPGGPLRRARRHRRK
eukprot:7361748-Alexandrium_andersonii.AAC.1